MNQKYNISNIIAGASDPDFDRPCILTAKDRLTYRDLRHITTCFALHLMTRGVTRASCVAIDASNTILCLASTLAIAMIGCRWVHATEPALQNSSLGTTHLLTDGFKSFPEDPSTLKIDGSWFRRPDTVDPTASIRLEGYRSPDDPWMIAQSSGTTGTAKHMLVSYRLFHKYIRKRTAHDDLYFGATPPVSVSLMHPLIKTSLATSLSALKLGGTVVAGGDYAFWQQAKANTVQGSPAQILEAIEGIEPPESIRIAGLRLSGAKCAEALIEQLFKYFETISVGYGSTEADNICRRLLQQGKRHDGRLGKPFDDVELEIIDDDGSLLGANEDGLIRLRTGTQVNGYIGDEPSSTRVFRDGWFYPGDVGHLTASGELVISGRETDILNLGGTKINALDVDAVIQSHPDVIDGLCFAKPNQWGVDELAIVVSVHADEKREATAQEIRDLCRFRLGVRHVPKHVHFSPNVPRSAKRKPMRHAAANLSTDLETF